MILCYKIDRIPVNYDKCLLLYYTPPTYFMKKKRESIILFLYLPQIIDMEEYIGTVIKVGGILIGSIMVLFVIWYIVKDILDISGKDSSDGQ